MATRVYYKHKRVENVHIPYSFQCENCLKQSGDLQANIVGAEATYNSNFKTISDERANSLARDAHKNLVKKVKEVYKDAQSEIYCTEFKDECPHCHAQQSWGVSGLKKKRFDVPGVILILGIMITGIVLLGHFFSEEEYFTLNLALGIFGASVGISAISLIWNSVKISVRAKKTSANMTQNKPNIDWSGVQQLLNEDK